MLNDKDATETNERFQFVDEYELHTVHGKSKGRYVIF